MKNFFFTFIGDGDEALSTWKQGFQMIRIPPFLALLGKE